jgi:hypothetical protein
MPAKLTRYAQGRLEGVREAQLYQMPRTRQFRQKEYARGYADGYQEAQPLWIERLAIHHYEHSIYKAHKGLLFDVRTTEKVTFSPEPYRLTHEVVLHDDGTWLLERSPWHSNHCRSQRIYFLRWLRRLWSSVASAEQALLLDLYKDNNPTTRGILCDWYLDHDLSTLALYLERSHTYPRGLPIIPRAWPPAPPEFDTVVVFGGRRHWAILSTPHTMEHPLAHTLCGEQRTYYQAWNTDDSGREALCPWCFFQKPLPEEATCPVPRQGVE